MVKKIRKLSKKGPKANYAVPLLIPLTALFGSRCTGRPFWNPFDGPSLLREVLSRHLGVPLLVPDRVLPIGEYLDWGLSASPGKVAGMFGRSGLIPMGPAPSPEEDSDQPRLGVLPIVAIVKGGILGEFFDRLGSELSEIERVAFEGRLFPDLGLIPGYDRLLYVPVLPARSLNSGVDHLNRLVGDVFDRAALRPPIPFDPCPSDRLAAIPTHEPISAS